MFRYIFVHLSFKVVLYIFFLCWLFCLYPIFFAIVELLSTRTNVYHCSKCFLVELLCHWNLERTKHMKCNKKRLRIHNTYKSITFSERGRCSTENVCVFISVENYCNRRKKIPSKIFLCRSLDSICIFYFPSIDLRCIPLGPLDRIFHAKAPFRFNSCK